MGRSSRRIEEVLTFEAQLSPPCCCEKDVLSERLTDRIPLTRNAKQKMQNTRERTGNNLSNNLVSSLNNNNNKKVYKRELSVEIRICPYIFVLAPKKAMLADQLQIKLCKS